MKSVNGSLINPQCMTTFSIILLALSILICCINVRKLIKAQQSMNNLLNVIGHCLISSNDTIEETLALLRQHNANSNIANAWILACLRPYIMAIQDKAVDREDYEEAGQCQHIIEEIDKLINNINIKQ